MPARRKALMCISSPQTISPETLIRSKAGSTPDGWRKTVLPAPDVVNNRLTSRKLENKPNVQHFIKEVKIAVQQRRFQREIPR